jgi:hypothetical protein
MNTLAAGFPPRPSAVSSHSRDSLVLSAKHDGWLTERNPLSINSVNDLEAPDFEKPISSASRTEKLIDPLFAPLCLFQT